MFFDHLFSRLVNPHPTSTLFPYTTLFRSRPVATSPRAFRTRPRGSPRRNRSRDSDAAGLDLASVLSRSEEHTSELQSRENLVCRLLLEKKKRCRARSR